MQGGRVAVFQFHYGTIKRFKPKNTLKQPKIFQFHYGTIKRLVNR